MTDFNTQPLEWHFWRHVTQGKTDACWLWQGSKFSNGYGVVRFGGRNLLAHRVSYQIHFGPIPSNYSVCHRCDIHDCVNPEHLFLGTHTDNMRDMTEKGRRVAQGFPGESHPRHKVTTQDVLAIRALWAQGMPQTEIAKKFGLVKQQIHNIVHRKSWAHVT